MVEWTYQRLPMPQKRATTYIQVSRMTPFPVGRRFSQQ